MVFRLSLQTKPLIESTGKDFKTLFLERNSTELSVKTIVLEFSFATKNPAKISTTNPIATMFYPNRYQA